MAIVNLFKLIVFTNNGGEIQKSMIHRDVRYLIKRNIDTNTSDLEKLYKKRATFGTFSTHFFF